MSVRFYMDVHVPRAITEGLRLRSIDVLFFTRDADLLAEATQRQRAGRSFAGLVYAHQLQVTIGQCVHDLELIAVAADLADLAGRVEHLPLR